MKPEQFDKLTKAAKERKAYDRLFAHHLGSGETENNARALLSDHPGCPDEHQGAVADADADPDGDADPDAPPPVVVAKKTRKAKAAKA